MSDSKPTPTPVPQPAQTDSSSNNVDTLLANTTGLQHLEPPSTVNNAAIQQPSTSSETSVNPLVNNPATTPATLAPADPKPTETPFDMLMAVKNIKLIQNSLNQINKFVPSSHQMFRIIHYMNEVLFSNSEICSSFPMLNPLIVRLYYSIVFYLQILRCMHFSGILPWNMISLYNGLMSQYPPDTIPIAGPLICYFQSLSTASPENENYGIVTPTLPTVGLGNASRAAALVPGFPHNWALPQPHLLRALLGNLYNTDVDTIIDTWNPLPDTAQIQGDPVQLMGFDFTPETPAPDLWALALPGLSYELEQPADFIVETINYGNSLNIPIPQHNTNTVGIANMLDILGNEWFNSLCQLMSKVNTHFKHSGNLNHCSPAGNGASLPISVVNIQNLNADWEHTPPGLFADSTVFEPSPSTLCHEQSLPSMIQQYSFMSQINLMVTPGVPGPIANFGSDQDTRTGPYWVQFPSKSVCDQNIYSELMRQTIIDKFFDPDAQ